MFEDVNNVVVLVVVVVCFFFFFGWCVCLDTSALKIKAVK